MLSAKLIDGIVEEPLGGAHTDPEATYEIVKQTILAQLAELNAMDKSDRIVERIEKFSKMGVVNAR